MSTLTASEARKNLYRLMDSVNDEHSRVIITGKRKNCVLMAEEDWFAIEETMHLLSIKGMRESIIKGMDEDIDECSEELDW